MDMFPFHHLIGCTPLTPCDSCKVVNLLRKKLSDTDFNDLISEIRAITGKIQGTFSALNPAPMNTSIDVLELTTRTRNCLVAENFLTIGEILGEGKVRLLKTANFGRKSLNELVGALNAVGLTL